MPGDVSPSAERSVGELESLMHAYQQADLAAADTLFNRLTPQVFQFFLGQVRNREQAEDLLQEFWLRIHKAQSNVPPG